MSKAKYLWSHTHTHISYTHTHTYLIRSREQDVGHGGEVGGFPRVDVSQHLLEYFRFKVVDLNTILSNTYSRSLISTQF